ncbi:MAG: D-2-hydroxyacid dehydrogenase [Deltaproteobacteria bacterium]|nr:D-2-hydroxyacid dehydrogenase [Candidatus Anaeroferrophillus wilburensis]MBN2887899.1 D-2-hydroxyacid dehydrogenase [Deltaproteobacteria bacterium]
MKIAAARSFHDQYAEQVKCVVPHSSWALFEPDGSWSSSPADCELAVLIGDAYCPPFKEALLQISALKWVHTENSGIDGDFYERIIAKDIILTNSPGANANEVVEFVIGLMLWTAKRFGSLSFHQSQHRWERLPLQSLQGTTVLIVGLGHVGQPLARFCKAFGMHVLGIRKSPGPVADVDQQGTLADLPRFLPRADVVVLALELTPLTRGIMARREFQLMKSTATLINVARSQIVDLGDLRVALQEQAIGQACLDVLPAEPWPPDDPFWDLPNVFITPHIAWSSPFFRQRASQMWLANLKRYVNREPLEDVIGEDHSFML